MLGLDVRAVLSGIGKSISKVFAPPSVKNGYELSVSFTDDSGAAKSFQVCLPKKLVKDRGNIRSKIYCAPLPKSSHGVVALVVCVDREASLEDPFKNAVWYCRFPDGNEKAAKVSFV